jgi:hypothetical protein
MATRIDEAGALTEQHRQAQMSLRARALRDFLTLWPIWHDDQSFGNLVTATTPLVRTYRSISAALAAAYFESARRISGANGDAAATAAAAINEAQLTTSLYVTGKVGHANALNAGQSIADARKSSFVRVSGAVTRHVLEGGRDTILQSVADDKQALGWARVTDGDPCYFCLTLASRGAVYKSEETASFEAHDHCGCSAMPVWDGTQLPEQTDQWKRIYDDAQREALASGDLQHGENSSQARLNAVRRHLAAK